MSRDLLPPAPLRIDVRPDRERVLVCPTGEIDLETAPTVQSVIVQLIESGFARVVVDMSGVTFLDSTGVRTLLAAHRRACELGAGVSLILGSSVARATLEIAGALDRLDLEDGPSRTVSDVT